MDHNRHYFGHKAAKDILMLMGENITVHDFKDKLFDGKAILNYLNDMILNVILYYSEIEDGFSLDFKDYMNNDKHHHFWRFDYEIHTVHIGELQRFDVGFLFLAEMLKKNTLNLYLENLYAYDDFK